MVKEGDKKKNSKSKAAKKTTTKKKTSPKKKAHSPSSGSRENRALEKILIENFISMQKVMTNMAEKFDHLTKQISSLLDLFDESAKALTEKEINLEVKGGEKEKEVLEKLNAVLDQNKLIAKGLTLMHETAVNPTSHYSLAPSNDSALSSSQGSSKFPMPTPPKPKFQKEMPNKSDDDSAPLKVPGPNDSNNFSNSLEPSLGGGEPDSFSSPEMAQRKKPKVMEEEPFGSREFS